MDHLPEGFVGIDQLKALTGYKRPSYVGAALRRHGITYFQDRTKGLWTTSHLINVAGERQMGLNRVAQSDEIDI